MDPPRRLKSYDISTNIGLDNNTWARRRGWALWKALTRPSKTGSGGAAESNDIGVVWQPGGPPLIISIYSAPIDPRASADSMHAVIAQATRIVVSSLVPTLAVARFGLDGVHRRRSRIVRAN
jgi:beta-lactamase class A